MRGSLGSNKHNKVRAMDREKKLAKRLGGFAQPGSGSGDDKGDVITDDYLIDDKFTDSKSYTVTVETLNKLSREARNHDKEPILLIKYTKKMPPFTPSEWCLIPGYLLLNGVYDEVDIRNKSTIISINMVGSLVKNSAKDKKDPIREYSFYECALGCSRKWVLCPLDYLERENYFDNR